MESESAGVTAVRLFVGVGAITTVLEGCRGLVPRRELGEVTKAFLCITSADLIQRAVREPRGSLEKENCSLCTEFTELEGQGDHQGGDCSEP